MKRDRYGSPEILGALSKLVMAAIVAAFIFFLVSYYMRVVNNSRKEMARNFVAIFLPTALDYYKEDIGVYPSTLEGLEALWKSPRGASNWNGPYISPHPLKDPWGREYRYACPGGNNTDSYDLWSTGRDLADEADDVRNWNIGETE